MNVRSFVLRSCSESKWSWRRWCCKVFFTSRQATRCTKTVALTCSLALLVHNQLRSQGNQAMYRGRKKQNELYNIWNISAKSSNYNIMIDLSLRVSSLGSWCSVVSKILWCAIFVVFFCEIVLWMKEECNNSGLELSLFINLGGDLQLLIHVSKIPF